LPGAARRTYRRTARRLRQAKRAPAGQPREAAYHEARKSAKRARYAGEAASPAIGKAASQFAKQMKQIQSVLGNHQDAVVTRRVDRELGISAYQAGENAFTYGLLYDREDQLALRLQAMARRAWKHRTRPQFREWGK
jgi:CHAD domain-containing protein